MIDIQTRILVVNPNTSQEVTEAIVQAMSARAPARVRLSGVTGAFGARIVSNEAENVVAAYAALDLVARHGAGFDAVILGISFDSGLRALQGALPTPCVGITEAALRKATADARPVGVIFFGEVSRDLYETLIASYGVSPVSFQAIDVQSVAAYLSPTKLDAAVIAAIHAAQEAGARTIMICGAAIVGMAARLQPHVSVPLFDGLAALDACLAQLATPQVSSRPTAKPMGPSINLSPELTRLIRGDDLE